MLILWTLSVIVWSAIHVPSSVGLVITSSTSVARRPCRGSQCANERGSSLDCTILPSTHSWSEKLWKLSFTLCCVKSAGRYDAAQVKLTSQERAEKSVLHSSWKRSPKGHFGKTLENSLLCASTIITTLKAKRGQPDSVHTVVIDRIRDRLLFYSSLWVFATDPGPVQAVSCLFLANNKQINALFVCLDAAKSFEAQTKIFLQIFHAFIWGWGKS